MKTFVRAAAAVLAAAVLCLNLYIELAPDRVVGPVWKLVFAAVFALLLGAAFFFGVPQAQRGTRRHDYLLILFWYYLWVLLNVLFFDNALGRDFSPMAADTARVNLQPLRTVTNYLAAYRGGRIAFAPVAMNLAGNLIAFAPMGCLLPALFRWQRSIFFFTATLTLSITAVEVAQVYSGAGSCDVDDLILNLAGALAVFVLCRITPLWRRVCAVTPRRREE